MQLRMTMLAMTACALLVPGAAQPADSGAGKIDITRAGHLASRVKFALVMGRVRCITAVSSGDERLDALECEAMDRCLETEAPQLLGGGPAPRSQQKEGHRVARKFAACVEKKRTQAMKKAGIKRR